MKWYLIVFLLGVAVGWLHAPLWAWIKSKLSKQTPISAANDAIKK
jgi:hypothetical protein